MRLAICAFHLGFSLGGPGLPTGHLVELLPDGERGDGALRMSRPVLRAAGEAAGSAGVDDHRMTTGNARCRLLCDPWRLKHNGHPSVPAVGDGAKDVAAAPMVLPPGADRQRQRPYHGLRLRPGITPANAWFPMSRTCPIGAGVNAMVEQPIIHRLNPQVP